ncbi:MAG: hypothetical protein LLF90_09355 [Methanomicrobiaceae archaeon]|uniref:hypothetical protein n=1 Tax=Methanoculleus sp. TaxID=90427 RepID=UPI00320D2C77|nr:hypothetical protein [Methanomicrobiaceae archaeon]
MNHYNTCWDGLDYLIVETVEASPGMSIPAVGRAIDPTIPEGTVRNRVRKLSAYGIIKTERVLGRYYALHPGAGLELIP